MVLHSSLITVMEKAARKAAPKLRRDFGEVDALQVSRKGPADFVSNADRAAEATIIEILLHARPDWGLTLEEGDSFEGADRGARWIVDPLDGTTNFLHGMPHFAISIAAEVNGETVAGLVHQPLTGESYWAEKGRGAWLSDRRLRVSARRDLGECVLATGIPFKGHGDAPAFTRQLAAVMPEVAGVRRFGAAALDLAWVAAGRFDGFWEAGLSEWDVAAGILLVKEAGGFVCDYRGGDQMVTRAEIVAGNAQVQSKLHKLVSGALRN
jgi:myo-inositol-1(or 4)-monophosphatase